MTRRDFTRNQKEQIIERSKNASGEICCEGCGLVLGLKPYEVDHILAEALRPEGDKKRPLTISEGQLLGKECCHRGEDGKTNKDVKLISKAKRQYNSHNGISAKKQKIRSPGFPHKERKEKLPLPQRQWSFYQAKETT
jgi:hypothetical protein